MSDTLEKNKITKLRLGLPSTAMHFSIRKHSPTFHYHECHKVHMLQNDYADITCIKFPNGLREPQGPSFLRKRIAEIFGSRFFR